MLKHFANLWYAKPIGDMRVYFPRRYEDYSQLKPIKTLFYAMWNRPRHNSECAVPDPFGPANRPIMKLFQ